MTSVNDVLQGILLGAIALVLVLPIGVRVARNRFDPFEPIVIFAIAYGVMFVVRPAAMLFNNERFFFGPRETIDVSSTFTQMLLLAFIGALGFVVGYEVRVVKGYSGLPSSFRYSVAVAGALLATVLCAAPFASYIVTEGGSNVLRLIAKGRSAELTDTLKSVSTYPWLLLLMLVPCALVLLAIGAKTRSAKIFALGGVVTALVLLRAVPVGDRLMLLPFLGGAFVFYYLRRSTRPRLFLLLVVAVVAFVGSAFIRDVRERQSRGESVGESLVKVTSHPDEIIHPTLRGAETDMAPALAVALELIPEHFGHTYGGTIFGDLITRPIPRALWEGKPLPPRERLMAKAWPRDYADGLVNSEFSVLLYLFWDFGWFGAFVGLALCGLGSRFLYEYLLHRSEDLSVQVVYSLWLWLLVIALRENPVDAVIHWTFLVLPAILIFLIASERLYHRVAASPSSETVRSSS